MVVVGKAILGHEKMREIVPGKMKGVLSDVVAGMLNGVQGYSVSASYSAPKKLMIFGMRGLKG